MKSKKAMGAMSVAIVIIILVVMGHVIWYLQRECNNNEDCPANHYCGSDFECHLHPEQTEVSIFGPSLILGFSIIIAAIIFRWEHIRTTFRSAKKKKTSNNGSSQAKKTAEEDDLITPDALDEYEDESTFKQK